MPPDLRFGRYQDVLQDVTCDCLMVDAPYSERVHSGAMASSSDGCERSPLEYGHWAPSDVLECVEFFASRVRGWWVSITDHHLAPVWEHAMDTGAGLYTFAPLPFVATGSRPRLSGDGPACWSCQIVVGRPRTKPYSSWGSLPGAYVLPNGLPRTERERCITGGKSLWLMRTLVRDYTRRGDVVCDPCAGAATTLLGAEIMGRVGIGAEMDRDRYEAAQARLRRGFTPELQWGE